MIGYNGDEYSTKEEGKDRRNKEKQQVYLGYLTKKWIREGKIVALRELISPDFSVLYQSWTNGGGSRHICESFTPHPKDLWVWVAELGWLVGILTAR